MKLPRLMRFLFSYTAIGLLLAAVIIGLRPDLVGMQDDGNARPENGDTVTQPVAPQIAQVRPAAGPASYADAVEQAQPAVVNIYTTKTVQQEQHPLFDDPFFRRFFGDITPQQPRERTQTSLGSGVIFSDQGYVVTNNHVIDDADEIQVLLADGREALASVVGRDPDTDLAVLRIELDRLPVIQLADDRALRVGDVVLAIGNPFGVGQTVTMGIVSATGRDQLGLTTFENFIQTDAAINPGNSGGALINAEGRLVGINTAIFSRTGGHQGIGFAIPAHLAVSVLDSIVEEGRVVRGWIGVQAQTLSPMLAESFGLDQESGIVISGVLRGGPASEAGLRPGDVVTHIEDERAVDAQTLLQRVTGKLPGDELTMRIVRDGEEKTLTIEVEERPAQDEQQAPQPQLR